MFENDRVVENKTLLSHYIIYVECCSTKLIAFYCMHMKHIWSRGEGSFKLRISGMQTIHNIYMTLLTD
jgi:hypothetical protein